MRIHTDTLTVTDIYAAAARAGGGDYRTSPVLADVTEHGSRSRARAFNVTLSGTSGRRQNPGHGGGSRDLQAATWDEWGMFLAELFRRDPNAVVPKVYDGAEHFQNVTDQRFDTLTPENQHRDHKWEFGGSASYGARTAIIRTCAGCDAEWWQGA